MKKIGFLMCIGLLGLLLHSCKKDDPKNGGVAHLNVRMTDAPANYDAIYIDLQSVEVTGTNNSTVLLNVNAGIYNLLDFRNGVDTLIAFAGLNPGTVEQIRLILGPNNSIVVDGVTHPLSTPSAEQSGLKLQVHQTLEAGITYVLLLDFEANKSIVETGNGTYKLKPVLRVIETAVTGSIRGSITPVGILADVTVSNGSVSFSTTTNLTGEFLIAGIPPGTYTVVVTPALPLLPITVNNVIVTTGVSTNIGIVAL